MAKDQYWAPGTPIEDLEISVRAANILRDNGIKTLGQLAEVAKAGRLYYRGLGSRYLKELLDTVDTFTEKQSKPRRPQSKVFTAPGVRSDAARLIAQALTAAGFEIFEGPSTEVTFGARVVIGYIDDEQRTEAQYFRVKVESLGA
jgi:hypothetical protein